MSASTIFIVDRERSIRAALGEILASAGYQTEQMEEPSLLLTAERVIPESACAIIDVAPPGTDIIGFLKEAEQRNLDLPIILMSESQDVRTAVMGLRAGAQDFLQKPIHSYTLLNAVRSVLSRASQQRKLNALRQLLQARFAELSPREVEMFQFVVRGLSNPEIGRRLKIGKRTVESYRLSMMEKMQASSVAELVLQAHALGQVPDWTRQE